MRKYTLFVVFAFSATAWAQTLDVPAKPVTRDAMSADDLVLPAPGEPYSENSVYNAAGIEVKPEYPGGIEQFYRYISEKVKVSADDNFTGGKVIVSFVVEKDGSLADVKILRDSARFGMAGEVVRVLKSSPKWAPGQQNGNTVRTMFTLPVVIAMPVAENENAKKK